ncbi:MAG: hypothetical protein IT439_11185 [Phycisphaerales bacterium]|nr:hypothetical protein [Phycisphaerales bacterium]
MARRRTDASASETQGAHVLLVAPRGAWRSRLARAVRACPVSCVMAKDALEAAAALGERMFDLVIAWSDLLPASLDIPSGTALVVVSEAPGVDDAVAAMRRGACDLLTPDDDAREVSARLEMALRRARQGRRQADRIRRLRNVCRQLNTARQEVSRQVGSLCNDLVSAYQELSEQMGKVSVASEFGNLVRPELEIEGLLRTVLEYLLAKGGPTNGAVFLPDSAGEFTLGAYVNFDCPKDGIEDYFDHLACAIAPRFDESPGVVHLQDRVDLADRLGHDARWLEGQNAVIFGARQKDETLAVVALFRGERAPFEADFIEMLPTIADGFARQLGRVIHVHHRGQPKHEDSWGLDAGFDPGLDREDSGEDGGFSQAA